MTMYLISHEPVGSDNDLFMFRTLPAAMEKFDSLIMEAIRDDDRDQSIFLYVVLDNAPNIQISHDKQRGFREWHGRWESHWREGMTLYLDSQPPDPEDAPRYHSLCGFVHGPDDCER